MTNVVLLLVMEVKRGGVEEGFMALWQQTMKSKVLGEASEGVL